MTYQRIDDEIETVAERMYMGECYIGHISWDHWRKFAAFAIKLREEALAQEKKEQETK